MSDSLQNKPRIFGCKTNEPLKFSVCGQLISPSGFVHHRRCFDENVLIMMTEGTLYITANNVEHALVPGQYIFLKAGEEHFGHRPSEGRLSYLWAHFRSDCGFETLNDENCEYTYLLPETLALSDSGRTAQLFHQLMDMSLEEKLYTQNMSDYAMSLLLMEISQEYFRYRDNFDKLPSAVVSAREWIKNHYYLPFDVTELAKSVGYSADYLSSLFKQSTGVSIVRYTNRLRIKTAKTLLSNYDITIKETAFSCGFSDEKYFMKVFK
ncbi:MAG: AraC family transcriptional regulator, partial [Oscillospiraceae bacterium]